jgi:hypothetical protein
MRKWKKPSHSGDFTPYVNTTVGNATLAPLNATKRWEELVSFAKLTNFWGKNEGIEPLSEKKLRRNRKKRKRKNRDPRTRDMSNSR